MSSRVRDTDGVDQAIVRAGLVSLFDARGRAFVDCPQCGTPRALKLMKHFDKAQCGACGLDGPLQTYLTARVQLEAGLEDDSEVYSVIDLSQAASQTRAERYQTVIHPPTRHEYTLHQAPKRGLAGSSLDAELGVEDLAHGGRHNMGEVIIITSLAFLFLGAGLAAALLSGFANYTAFGTLVSDPLQARIWGGAGVIASIITFGGFTFFWWHMAAKRFGEAARVLVFALAGAATSIAGTSLYMSQHESAADYQRLRAAEVKQLHQAELSQAERQLAGISPDVRSVAGLEAYLKGVEAVGRTHHKAYRDAQNELGLAQRRAALEAEVKSLRQTLRETAGSDTPDATLALPAWGFAILLELFSSQGTSVACVALLLLYSRRREPSLRDHPPRIQHAIRV